jgi:hypothetical protein
MHAPRRLILKTPADERDRVADTRDRTADDRWNPPHISATGDSYTTVIMVTETSQLGVLRLRGEVSRSRTSAAMRPTRPRHHLRMGPSDACSQAMAEIVEALRRGEGILPITEMSRLSGARSTRSSRGGEADLSDG